MSTNMSGSSQITVGLHRVQTTAKAIRYHTTETRRLLAVTIDGLSHNGIESFGMGDAVNGVFILSGGLKLTPHAAAQLPLFAGGAGPGGVSHMDRRTVSFLDAVNISSPAGYKGASVDYSARQGTPAAHLDREVDMQPTMRPNMQQRHRQWASEHVAAGGYGHSVRMGPHSNVFPWRTVTGPKWLRTAVEVDQGFRCTQNL